MMNNDLRPQPPYVSAPPTNTLAAISLASGILSWFMLPFMGGLVAVITGHMARREIKASYGAQGGDGLAVVGLLLGYLHLLGVCLGILIFVLFFGSVIGLSGYALLSGAGGPITGMVMLLLPSS